MRWMGSTVLITSSTLSAPAGFGEKEAAALAALRSDQAAASQRLHYFGEIARRDERGVGDLLVGLRIVGMRGQPDDGAERIFYCLRQHLDIWMIVSTYRLSSRRKFWATHRSRSRLRFRFRGSVLAEVR